MQFTLVRQQKVADIFTGAGHVILASMVIPYFVDQFQVLPAFLGLMGALAAWGFGVILADKI